ncbi:hypothetical protein EGJ86_05245 [Pseudomonas sp. o96-267]|uniref:PIN domain-containing protein n=1 Tax=Pseudomonas sp. o96-267 TaxID=2479853 RepID=UPI000F76CBD5|nr:PIN domain-containing protein [Pseudomonas sp. o96-267]RRV42119.1 hypothetical protein EGJ86_05245 [Pseudomonas sp. o96-267]
MRVNFVLIDYESVQPDDVAIVQGEQFKVIVFVGATQSKVSFEVASALQKMGDRAEYIKISGTGHNALDFHVAYYIGVMATKQPDSYFHIISKDTGFDPLIAHLKTQKIFACRSATIGDIPLVKVVNSNAPGDRIEIIVNDLKKRGNSRPRAVKTLSSTINSMFQKRLSAQEIDGLIEGLRQKGFVKVNGTKVSYSLPAK